MGEQMTKWIDGWADVCKYVLICMYKWINE